MMMLATKFPMDLNETRATCRNDWRYLFASGQDKLVVFSMQTNKQTASFTAMKILLDLSGKIHISHWECV